MKRILYLGYYLKKLDREQFRLFFNHVRASFGVHPLALMADVIGSSVKYNISFLEYFQFRFHSSGESSRREWAGTGYMYEYQLMMNPKSERRVLEDKTEFIRAFSPFIARHAADLESLRENEDRRSALLGNPSGKIVLKNSRGQCGWQVLVVEANRFQGPDLVQFMEKERLDLAEEYIVQHPDLAALSPSGVNTVRIITQLKPDGEVEILGARLRISVSSPVDNLASGNIAASVDLENGVVNGPGVYSDITKEDVTVHPATGAAILGFQIPSWPEVKAMARQAAVVAPGNRSVGWDIAVTSDGPELIEGNHDWCKLVWQLPVHRGLKPVLDRHLAEFLNGAEMSK